MEMPVDYSALEQTIERAMKSDRERDAVESLGEAVEANAPFPAPERPVIARDCDTEYLLNGLIAECHYVMRELVLPTAAETKDGDQRVRFISSVIDLARTGASVGKAVAKLRAAGQMPELRQRHIVEHLGPDASPRLRDRACAEKNLQT
jgi:hypothetical protein